MGGEVITFSGYPSSLSGPGSTGTLTATVSNSGLTVTFSSLTPSICTVSGATVTAVSAGHCEVAADQAGGTGTNGYLYGATTEVIKTIPVGTPQTITFGSPPLVLEGGSGTLTATSSSGLPVIFGTTTPTVCTIVGSVVTGIGVGQCIVTADEPGNAQYLPAPEVLQTIGI
jgi:large repetitive protein